MKKNKVTLLLVEDDENLGFILKDYLEMLEYKVFLETDGQKGFETFKNLRKEIDLCIIDVMLPIKDGYALTGEIRDIDKKVPIIFLTAKSMKDDKIKGFKAGADDYITKPFSSEELTLRIEAILRRYRNNYKEEDKDSETIFNIGVFEFDFLNQLLKTPTRHIRLTKKESAVLRMLCLHKNSVLKREHALKTIWGEADYFMGRSMDVYITKLRKYLKESPNITISNIHGTGFKLEITDNNAEDEN